MPSSTSARHATLSQTYQERASLPNTSPLAAYLLRLIAAKQTNLCVSADVTATSDLLRLAEEVGDSICLLKTHADIIQDFGHKTMQGLQNIAKRKGFLIFEDRKFGDIGSTVQKQYTAGPLQIVRWANVVNCHIFPGPAIITALHSAADDAVAAYSTSVETQISGPPGYENDNGDVEDPAEEEETYSEPEEQEGDRLSSSESSGDDTEEEPTADLERRMSSQHISSPDRSGRKLSVVSVSTTISTKTESISPAPTPAHNRTFSSSITTSPIAEDAAAALTGLGDPPMARGLLLLAEMSSAGNLMNGDYVSACVAQARKDPEFVMGFIAQRSLNAEKGDNFITMTPGVQIGATGDALGQQYNTPEKVVRDAGTDVVIVGRGIYAAQDRRRAAEDYRARAWRAYEERIGRRGK